MAGGGSVPLPVTGGMAVYGGTGVEAGGEIGGFGPGLGVGNWPGLAGGSVPPPKILEMPAAGIDISSIQITSEGVNGFAGNPGSTVIVSLTTNLRLITPFISRYFGPSGEYVFTVSTTFKNEPFDPSDAI